MVVSLKNDFPHELSRATKKNFLTVRLQRMLVWISICKENHALRAWREITWQWRLAVTNVDISGYNFYQPTNAGGAG